MRKATTQLWTQLRPELFDAHGYTSIAVVSGVVFVDFLLFNAPRGTATAIGSFFYLTFVVGPKTSV